MKSIQGVDIKYKGILGKKKTEWTLCVGAGISNGIIPVWSELTRNVVNQVFSKNLNYDDFKEITKNIGWSLDVILQSCANKIVNGGGKIQQFNEILEGGLYNDIFNKISDPELVTALKKALHNPRLIKQKHTIQILEFLEASFKDASLLKITKVLADAYQQEKSPSTIITFNAETLLYACLDMYLIKSHSEKNGTWQLPKEAYKKVLRSADGISKGLIPIYHCHGSIYPKTSRRVNDSREQLVFLEESYLNIAANMSTWAQTLFLYYAQNTNLLIIGHSLSDPNIRKWLHWSFELTKKEINNISGVTDISPRHIWINKKPEDILVQEIQEAGLLHLGVKICWIDEWDQVDQVIRNLLNLKNPS